MIKKQQLLQQKENALAKKDFEQYFSLLIELIRKYPDRGYNYDDCNLLIEHGYLEYAKKALKEMQNSAFSHDKIKHQFLFNKINQLQYYSMMSEEEKYRFEALLRQGSQAYQEKDLPLAYDYYEAGKYLFDNVIFDYYLGKIDYKIHDYKQALFHLKKFIREGYWRYEKACLYLSKIYYYKKDYQKANQIASTALKLEPYAAEEYRLDNFLINRGQLKGDFKPNQYRLKNIK